MIRSGHGLGVFLAASLVASSGSGGDESATRRATEWGEIVDPSRDCKVSYDTGQARLTIAVPGTPHVLSSEIAGLPLDAPRVVQEVNGGFRASVKVAGKLKPGASRSTKYDPYHGAGLIVWKDERNYLRLERAVALIRGVATPYLNYELREDGRLTLTRGIPIKDHSHFLKLERANGEIRAWHSPDGSRWSELPDRPVSIAGRVQVGVVAINSSKQPLRAELERFRIEPSDGPEDPRESSAGATAKPASGAGDRPEAK